jgi:hypothetical protein
MQLFCPGRLKNLARSNPPKWHAHDPLFLTANGAGQINASIIPSHPTERPNFYQKAWPSCSVPNVPIPLSRKLKTR